MGFSGTAGLTGQLGPYSRAASSPSLLALRTACGCRRRPCSALAKRARRGSSASDRGVQWTRSATGPGDELQALRIAMLSVWITPLQRDTLILSHIPRNTLNFILYTAYVISTKRDHFWPRADEILYKSMESNVPESSIIQCCAFPNRLRWMHWDAT